MAKQMKEPSSNFLELDKAKIDAKISESGEYYTEDIYIKKWWPNNEEGSKYHENSSDQKEGNKYLATLEKNGCRYTGSLNDKFQREGYGLEIYNNGDKYFGQFEANSRNENGIYFFAPTKNEDKENPDYVQNECFFGQWKNNLRDKFGIYLFVSQPEDNFKYENADFDAFVGQFEEEKYLRGTHLSKSKDEYYIYHGNFDKEGKKTDDNAFFYTSKTNKIFHGKIQKDILQIGYLATLNEDGETIKDIVLCKFNEDGSIDNVYEENQLSVENVEYEKKYMIIFRKIITDGDYFAKLYNKYSKIKGKIDEMDNLINIMERDENIAVINKLLNKYNKKNIYFDIERNFFGREI